MRHHYQDCTSYKHFFLGPLLPVMSIYTQVRVKYCNVFIYLYAMLFLKLGMTLDK